MRYLCLVTLLTIVSCKIDRHQSDVTSEYPERTRFSYHLELKGKGFIGSFGGVSGHKMLGDLGCLSMTVDRKADGYLIAGDSTRKAKKEGTNDSAIYVVKINDTKIIEVDKNYRPSSNHNQFSLLLYLAHLAKTGSGRKGLTFGYDMDFAGRITAVDGRIKNVKNRGKNLRYEMKGKFTKPDGRRREFDLGYTEHGSNGRISEAEIVIPKEITGEKTDVGVLLTLTDLCQVVGINGQEWNFDNPVTTGQG